jgi:hypothetical protein
MFPAGQGYRAQSMTRDMTRNISPALFVQSLRCAHYTECVRQARRDGRRAGQWPGTPLGRFPAGPSHRSHIMIFRTAPSIAQRHDGGGQWQRHSAPSGSPMFVTDEMRQKCPSLVMYGQHGRRRQGTALEPRPRAARIAHVNRHLTPLTAPPRGLDDARAGSPYSQLFDARSDPAALALPGKRAQRGEQRIGPARDTRSRRTHRQRTSPFGRTNA